MLGQQTYFPSQDSFEKFPFPNEEREFHLPHSLLVSQLGELPRHVQYCLMHCSCCVDKPCSVTAVGGLSFLLPRTGELPSPLYFSLPHTFPPPQITPHVHPLSSPQVSQCQEEESIVWSTDLDPIVVCHPINYTNHVTVLCVRVCDCAMCEGVMCVDEC